jgi:hypothetical protein
MLHRRHFTLDQANALVPAVDRVLREVRGAHARLVTAGHDAELAVRAETTGGAWPGREHARATLMLSLGFEHLEDLGVLVRDVERGIVDFPALMDGREVYLCWRFGEAAITHWHELHSGIAGRRPLGRAARRTI